MSIYITGDLHGNNDIEKFNHKHFKEGLELTKDDYVIICGDFGLTWYDINHSEYEEQEMWLNWLNEKPWTTLFVDGNHENFDTLMGFPEETMFGGKVGKIKDSIFHLKRGYVYDIQNLKFLTIGGATSTDKNSRLSYFNSTGEKTWWEDELLSREEEDFCIENLEKNDNIVDYIISHTAPSTIITKIVYGLGMSNRVNDPVARFLDLVSSNVEFKHWYFGHMHVDQTYDEKYTCLYYEIQKIV